MANSEELDVEHADIEWRVGFDNVQARLAEQAVLSKFDRYKAVGQPRGIDGDV